MRAVFLNEESVDCLSGLISAEFNASGGGGGGRVVGRGEEDLEPRVLKASCVELGAS